MISKKNFVILMVVCAVSVLLYVGCAFYFNDNKIKISKSHINKLDIDENLNKLKSVLGYYTDDQLRAIIISTAICSQISINKPNSTNKIEIIDNFRLSLKNFMFNNEKGIEYVFNNNFSEHKHIKMFFEMMKKGFMYEEKEFLKNVSKYNIELYNALKNVDESVKNFVENTKIEFFFMKFGKDKNDNNNLEIENKENTDNKGNNENADNKGDDESNVEEVSNENDIESSTDTLLAHENPESGHAEIPLTHENREVGHDETPLTHENKDPNANIKLIKCIEFVWGCFIKFYEEVDAFKVKE